MSHARERITYYPDPGIGRGPFRILPYTPGGWIVFDDRAPLGRAVVGEPFTFQAHGGQALVAACEALKAAARELAS